MVTTAVVVIAGATATGYSFGHRPGHVAPAPAVAASSSPSPDVEAAKLSDWPAEPGEVTSTPVAAEQESTRQILTRDAAEGVATDSYYFGHNYGLGLDDGSLEGTSAAAECALASDRYVEGEYGDYQLAVGAADVLRSNYVTGCAEAAQAMLERGVYADSTAEPPAPAEATRQYVQSCEEYASQGSLRPPHLAIGEGGDVALGRALDHSTWVRDQQLYDSLYTSCERSRES